MHAVTALNAFPSSFSHEQPEIFTGLIPDAKCSTLARLLLCKGIGAVFFCVQIFTN